MNATGYAELKDNMPNGQFLGCRLVLLSFPRTPGLPLCILPPLLVQVVQGHGTARIFDLPYRYGAHTLKFVRAPSHCYIARSTIYIRDSKKGGTGTQQYERKRNNTNMYIYTGYREAKTSAHGANTMHAANDENCAYTKTATDRHTGECSPS